MRILVTGATGFVASHLIPALADSGHDLVALGHDSSRIPVGDAIEPLFVDLAAPEWPALPTVDAIVHLAQANVPFPDGADLLCAVNTTSTARLLDHGRRTSASRFVFASSASVYGFGDRAWGEDDPATATDFYSATKLASERFVGAYSSYFGTTILRFVAPYGPGQRNRLIPRLISNVREGRPISLNAGGRPRMNPLYVGDAVTAISAALAAEGHHLVNAAGDEAASIRELAERIGRLVGCDPVLEAGSALVAGDIVCDNNRLHELLGLGKLVGLDAGLERALAT